MKKGVDDSYRLLAVRYVAGQVKALRRHLAGARLGEDVECVHQARVASRRLRAALRMFGDAFPRGKVKAWRRGIRGITDQLGPARDKDVQILFVREFLDHLAEKSAQGGVRRLLLRLEQQRNALQPKVVEAVDRLEESGLLKEMRSALKGVLTKLKGSPLHSPFVLRTTADAILDRLGKLLKYEPCVARPDDHEQHHQMRIAAKRLRYRMETCKLAYAGELDEPIVTVKHVQKLLGDIHDCDVWVEYLPTFVEAERERTRQYYGHDRPMRRLAQGIGHLGRERQQTRCRLFEQFQAFWQELRERRFWRLLAEMLRTARQGELGAGVDRASQADATVPMERAVEQAEAPGAAGPQDPAGSVGGQRGGSEDADPRGAGNG